MAKITINGDAIVVTSSVKLEDLRKVQEARPKALILMGGEDNKEEIYRVAVAKTGTGSIDNNGAAFAKATNNGDGLASITAIVNGVTGDIKEFVAKKYGAAVVLLNQIEAAIPDVLKEIEAEEAEILKNITVVQ